MKVIFNRRVLALALSFIMAMTSIDASALEPNLSDDTTYSQEVQEDTTDISESLVVNDNEVSDNDVRETDEETSTEETDVAETDIIPSEDLVEEQYSEGEIGGVLEGEITWAIDADGVITIGGAGAMSDQTKPEAYPWYTYKNQITGIVIGKDITHVGDYAFKDYSGSKLTSLTFEEGSQLKSIGNYSFRNLDYIHEIILPQGIVKVGNYAFDDSERITTLDLATVEEIGEYAFKYISYDNTYKLTSITIPKTVKSIGKGAFSNNWHVESITFENGSNLESLGENAFAQCKKLPAITLPKSINSIGKGIFSGCGNLASVSLEEGLVLTEIPENTFNGCESLSSFVIPGTVTSIGNSAFYNCKALESISIPSAVTKLGDYAFQNCKNISSITIPKSVTSMGSNCFYGCEKLETVTFEEGINLKALPWASFKNCKALLSISLPESVTELGDSCFEACESLASVTGEEHLAKIAANCFKSCVKLTEFTWPNLITTIPNSCFEASGLTSFTIPENVKVLGNSAFKATSIETITLPSSVNDIGGNLFLNCTKLKTVNFAEGYSYTTIYGSMFEGCSALESITLPSCVNRIDGSAFKNCVKLKTINVAEGQITTLGSNAFEGCTVLETFIISANATSVSGSAYKNCQAIKKVVLPVGITSIGYSAFEGCSSLEEIKLTAKEDGTFALKEIGSSAFKNCSSLKAFTIPASFTQKELQSSVFEGCSTLSEVTIDATSITRFYSSVFKNCSSLESIVIPDTVETIDGSCFYNCAKLSSVTLPSNVKFTEIKDSCFYGCEKLATIAIPATVTKICSSAFKNCSSLKEISLPESLTQIDGNVFENSGLVSVTIPSNVNSMGYSVFLGCANLDSVTVVEDSKLTSISGDMFKNCTGLKSIEIPKSVTSVASSAFNGCSSLERINVAESNTKYKSLCGLLVEKTSDNGYGSLIIRPAALGSDGEMIVLPNDLKEIKNNYFGGLTSLKKITIPSTVETVAGSAFSGCSALSEVIIGKDATGKYTLKSIPDSLFKNCSSLKSFIIPDTVEKINYQAFYNCSSLETIDIPASVTDINNTAFQNCSSLKAINVAEDNPSYYSIFGIVFNKSNNSQYITPAGLEKPFVIPESQKVLTQTIINLWADNQGTGVSRSTITEFTVSKAVNSIDSNAFSSLYNLKNIYVDSQNESFISWDGVLVDKKTWQLIYKPSRNEGSFTSFPDGITAINKGFFNGNKSITELNLPASVNTIGSEAYAYCTGLVSVTIPKNVTSVSSDAFLGCSSLKSILVEEGNTAYYSKNGCLYSKATGKLVIKPAASEPIPPEEGDTEYSTYYMGNTEITQVVIPSTIERISPNAFKGCTSLKKVTFASGSKLKAIGSSAFEDCSALTSIALPATLETIGNSAFKNSGLTSISIPKSVTYVGSSAFYSCASLTKVTYVKGSELTSINEYTFYKDSKLTSVTLPSKLTYIGSSAFAYTGFTSVTIPDTVTTISSSAYSYCTKLKSVAIKAKITTVPGNLFTGCSALTSVSLPVSVTAISSSAFKGLSNLSTVNLSALKNLTTIGSYAFSGTKLASVSLPTSVKSVGEGAFSNCKYLKTATIPTSVTDLGDEIFDSCSSLTKASIPTIEMGDYIFWDCTKLTSVTFTGTSTMTSIPDGMFGYCSSLTAINIPDTVTSIGESAFCECTKLTSVSIPSGVKIIDCYAFDGCSNLSSVSIGDVDYEKISECSLRIDEEAFANCSSLVTFRIPIRTTYISRDAFTGCTKLEKFLMDSVSADAELTYTVYDGIIYSDGGKNFYIMPQAWKTSGEILIIPEGTETIGNQTFSGNTDILYIELPSTIKEVGSYAFENCTRLKKVTFKANPETNKIALTSIGARAFVGCSDLSSVVFEGDVEALSAFGAYAFQGCENLTYVDFLGSSFINKIDTATFKNCYELKSIRFADNKCDIAIGTEAFYNDMAFEGLFNGDGLASLGSISKYAFRRCGNIKALRLGKSFASVALMVCSSEDNESSTNSIYPAIESMDGFESLENIFVDEGNEAGFTAVDGVVFSSSNELVWFPEGRRGKYVIPEGTLAIGDRALAGATHVTEIVVPSSVQKLGKYSFSGMTGLKSVSIAEGSALTYIDNYSFALDSALGEFALPPSVTTINMYAFTKCNAIKQMTIPDSVVNMGIGLFYMCTGLQTVTFSKNITSIPKTTFRGCYNFTSFVIPENITYIGVEAFYNCDLQEISIPAKVTEIDDKAFYFNNDMLIDFSKAASLKTIGSEMFHNNSAIEEIVLPEGLTSIGAFVFNGCSNLKSVTLPSTLTTLDNSWYLTSGSLANRSGNYMFYNCQNLEKVIVKNDDFTFGKYMFYKAGSSSGYIVLYGNKASSTETYISEKQYETSYITAKLSFDTLDNVNKPVVIEDENPVNIEGYANADESIGWKYDGKTRTLSFAYIAEGSSVLADEEYDKWYTYANKAEKLVIGEGITEIELGYRFWGNETIKTVEIASTVEEIEPYSFAEMETLETVNFADNSVLKKIPDNMLCSSSNVSSIEIPKSVIEIGNYAFYSVKKVNAVNLPKSVKTIGISSFGQMSSLETISFEAGSELEVIESNAFYYDNKLKTFALPEGLKTLDSYAMAYTGLEGTVTLPGSLVNVADTAFYKAVQIERFELSGSNEVYLAENGVLYKKTSKNGKETISAWIIPDKMVDSYVIPSFVNEMSNPESINVKEIVVAEDNPYFKVVNGCLYSKDGTVLYRVPSESETETIVVEDGTTTIGEYAFADSNAKNVVLPDSVSVINRGAFRYMNELQNISIPGKVSVIPDSCFFNCTGLVTATLGDNIVEIGNDAFYNCDSIEEIVLPKNLSSIGQYAFAYMDSLRQVDIPGSVSEIQYGTFEYDHALKEVTLHDGLVYIGTYAFEHCDAMKELSLPDTVETLDRCAFYYCEGLSNIKFGANLREIGIDAFSYCTSLKRISLPDGITSLNNNVFSYCTALESVYIPASVTDIYYNTKISGSDTIYYGPFYECGDDVIFYGESGSYAEAFLTREDVRRTSTGYYNQRYDFRVVNSSKYSITYMLDTAAGEKNSLNNVYSYRTGDSAITLYPASKPGYIFAGWYLDSKLTEAIECISTLEGKNYILYPKWLRNNVVTIMAYSEACIESGVGYSVEVPTGYKLSEKIEKPERTNYVFAGLLDSEGKFVDFETEIIEDITLTAQWKSTSELTVYAPYASVKSGEIETDEHIYLASETDDATIIYSFDGIPEYTVTDGKIAVTGTNRIYSEAITDFEAGKSVTIYAKAVKKDIYGAFAESLISKFEYSVKADSRYVWGDIVKEDRALYGGDPLRVPEGIWIAGVPDSTPYTGSNITFDVRVYDNKTLLTPGKDYKITYSNNKKAELSTAKKAPSVTVMGLGNYSGKRVVNFTIEAVSIKKADVTFANYYLVYTGKAQKPAPIVTYNGIKLKSGSDYTLRYDGMADDDSETGVDNSKNDYSNAGDWTVTVVGKGNFEGETIGYYVIKEGVLLSKVKINNFVSSIVYDTSGEFYSNENGFIQSKMTLTYQANKKSEVITLEEDVDYNVDYYNNESIGTVKMVITPTYESEWCGSVTKTFKITGIDVKKAKITGFVNSFAYTGSAITQKNIVLETKTDRLVYAQDYSVSYTNNVKAGTATMLIKGLGKYTGTMKKTYKIAAYNLKNDEKLNVPQITATVCYDGNGGVNYVKGGAKPSVSVRYKGRELKENVDYKLSYKNNAKVMSKDALKAPVVTISGKGNFTGSISLNFDIVSADISKLELTAKDVLYKNAAGNYATTITLKDKNGKTLSAGSDYEKALLYTYAEPTKLEDGSVKKVGDVVSQTDKVPAGTRIRITVKAFGDNYYGTVSTVYKVSEKDISKGKVTVKKEVKFIYNGRMHIPSKDALEVKVGGDILTGDDFEIISCTNNVKKGTAILVIKGKNGYCGQCVTKFVIDSHNISQ